MAFDLIGLNPTGIEGRHFRRNITSWYHLWDSISDLYPEIASRVEYAYSNDGDILDKKSCEELATLIVEDIENGTINHYCYQNFTAKKIISPQYADYYDFYLFLTQLGGFKIC